LTPIRLDEFGPDSRSDENESQSRRIDPWSAQRPVNFIKIHWPAWTGFTARSIDSIVQTRANYMDACFIVAKRQQEALGAK
jgi:hypothetical protein